MDIKLLRDKCELIIKGLECMCDPEGEDEFIKLLDDFTQKQILKCKVAQANQKTRLN